MAALNLNQITERLNQEFSGEKRQLIFWYDATAEFQDEIDGLQLANAKIIKLTPNNQFKTKYLLERQDVSSNYLIYAPFAKPDVRENHLEDTVLYSKRFYADKTSLVLHSLGIDTKFRPVFDRYSKFFASKDRIDQFVSFGEKYNDEITIQTGIMSVICKLRSNSFEQVMHVVLAEKNLEDNRYLAEFKKYDLDTTFWKFIDLNYGYNDINPNLKDFMVTLFVTDAEKALGDALPKKWERYVSKRTGNAIAFLDNLMQSSRMTERYDELSQMVSSELNAGEELKKLDPEAILLCDNFAEVDTILLYWIMDRLLNEDTAACLKGYTIPQICEWRKKQHFGERFTAYYGLLNCAYHIILAAKYRPAESFKAVINQYATVDYQIDRTYRDFYGFYDAIQDKDFYEDVRKLVENIYTNVYLGQLLPAWNKAIQEDNALDEIPLQIHFYTQYVKQCEERTVVIISDALRYEVAQELFEKLNDHPRCRIKLEPMLSTLPSYTRLGMSALLPHAELSMSKEGDVLVDGIVCSDIVSREKALQKAEPASCAVQFDTVKNKNRAELRQIFTKKETVYVYHDRVDNAGEHMEDSVFEACTKAVKELTEFVLRLSSDANTYHFIITADHGFIYRRDKAKESGKIGAVKGKYDIVKRRYIIAQKPVIDDGIGHMNLGKMLGNKDERIISYPCGSSVFKAAGSGGLNYVHGGSSPQEMLVPVIDIKMERYHKDTKPVQIQMVSTFRTVTSYEINVDFIQSEPISDMVKEERFRICFTDDMDHPISNEVLYIADKRDVEDQKRMFRLRFTLKNQKYDNRKRYQFVVYQAESGMAVFTYPVTIDIASMMDDLFTVK